MRTAALLLSLASSHATPCSCTGAPAPASSWQKCSATGDPHYRTFAGTKYDFMARGVYRHLKADLATCGCDLEVQTFLAASTQHIGASSIVALAVKIGDATLIFEATLGLTVSGSDNDQTLAHPDDAGGAGVSFGEQLVATKVSITNKGKERVGWQLSIPGGGEIIAISYPKPNGLPTGALLSVWVSVPEAVASLSSGHCKQTCSGLPPLPNTQCGDDDCLPVFTENSLFPTSFLTRLEALVPMPSSTRTSSASCGSSTNPCLVCDGNTPCVDICGWTDPYPSPPPPPAGGVEVERCGFPSSWLSQDRIGAGGLPDGANWILSGSNGCKQCEDQGEYKVKDDYNSDRQRAYEAAVQRCAQIPECSQVIGNRIEAPTSPRDKSHRWKYLLQGCSEFPTTGDCSKKYQKRHEKCDADGCGDSWYVWNRYDVTDGTCAEGTGGGAAAPAPPLPSPPPVPGTRPVPKCPSSDWRSKYVVRTAPRPPRRIRASHAVGVPDLASLTCACRCSLARAVGVGFGHEDRAGAGGLAEDRRLPQLVRSAGGGIVRAAQRAQERLQAGQPCQNTVASKAAHGPCPSPLSRSWPPSELWRGAQANAPPQGLPAGRKAAAFDPPGWVAPSALYHRRPPAMASAPPSTARTSTPIGKVQIRPTTCPTDKHAKSTRTRSSNAPGAGPRASARSRGSATTPPGRRWSLWASPVRRSSATRASSTTAPSAETPA